MPPAVFLSFFLFLFLFLTHARVHPLPAFPLLLLLLCFELCILTHASFALCSQVEDVELLAAARALVAALERELAAVAALLAACDARTLAALDAALANAASLGLGEGPGSAEVAQATTLQHSLVAEQACKGALRHATAAKDQDALATGLAEAQQLGLTGPEVRETNRPEIPSYIPYISIFVTERERVHTFCLG